MTTLNRYVPLTPATWRQGQPLVYFMKTNTTAYMPPGGGRVFLLSQRTPPFQMTTEPGVLMPDGLPGRSGERYRKNNIALASPTIMLNLSSGADVQPFFVTAGVSGILGLFHAGRRGGNGPAPAASGAKVRQRLTQRLRWHATVDEDGHYCFAVAL